MVRMTNDGMRAFLVNLSLYAFISNLLKSTLFRHPSY
jgi:hypothetical protein